MEQLIPDVKRSLRIRAALSVVLVGEIYEKSLYPTEETWECIETVVHFLEPFYKITQELQGDKALTHAVLAYNENVDHMEEWSDSLDDKLGGTTNIERGLWFVAIPRAKAFYQSTAAKRIRASMQALYCTTQGCVNTIGWTPNMNRNGLKKQGCRCARSFSLIMRCVAALRLPVILVQRHAVIRFKERCENEPERSLTSCLCTSKDLQLLRHQIRLNGGSYTLANFQRLLV
jgi:hypothetical protein